jgi:hypothetical protein
VFGEGGPRAAFQFGKKTPQVSLSQLGMPDYFTHVVNVKAAHGQVLLFPRG